MQLHNASAFVAAKINKCYIASNNIESWNAIDTLSLIKYHLMGRVYRFLSIFTIANFLEGWNKDNIRALLEGDNGLRIEIIMWPAPAANAPTP